jgi:hypothetical protein
MEKAPDQSTVNTHISDSKGELMCTTRIGRAVPIVGILTLACLVLVSTGALARVPGESTLYEAAASRTAVFGTADEVYPEPSAAREGSRQRPTLPYHVDTEHFRIWYDTTGPDMMYGWPDTTYLHECKAVAERCWRGIVDTLGFRPPPPDGSDPDGGGGSDHYDIYIMDIEYNALCHPCYSTPGHPPGARSSYSQLNNDFLIHELLAPIDFVRICESWLVEFAALYAHDYGEALWFQSATVGWCTETMYDDINNFAIEWEPGQGCLLDHVLGYPYVSLDWPESNHSWGMILWNLYLSEKHGAGIIPEIWYECEESEGITWAASTDRVLGDHGTSLEDAVEEFWIWNWFTGGRDDGNHYEEGGDPGWPESTPQATYSTFPVVGGSPPDAFRPDHLACNYVHFERGSADDEVLHITYDGPSIISVPQAVHVTYLDNSLDAFYYGEISLNPWGNGDIYVEGFDEMSLVCLVVVNKSLGMDNMNYAEPVHRGHGDSLLGPGRAGASGALDLQRGRAAGDDPREWRGASRRECSLLGRHRRERRARSQRDLLRQTQSGWADR